MEKNNKKVINAWCMYDWANSVFSLTITTAIFPEYFLAVTPNNVDFLSFHLYNDVLMSYIVSASFLFAALLSPFLTSIADYSGRKKLFMQAFCYLGSLACLSLYFFKPESINGEDVLTEQALLIGVFGFFLGLVGYSGSIVFYNSFLPEVADETNYDRVSAKGFSLGYIGSVLLLIINLATVLGAEQLGITTGEASRISFLTVGLWWLGFSQYTFRYLPKYSSASRGQGNWIFNGLKELKKVFHEVQKRRLLKIFLLSFFFYNMGVQTVMYLAPLFAKKEIELESANLIMTILIIQLVAIVGATFFNYTSSKLGNTRALLIGIAIWILVCAAAYFVQKGIGFYILAAMIGFVMGGIQSLSRSTYSKLIPDETTDHASYFSFYDVADKISTVLGTFMFGFVKQVTGSMRNSVLVIAVLFVIGGIILSYIPSKKVYSDK
ncbi:MAG TPA: MFS transporter [Cytophagaceae bacterium]|jgi:UMF1 family MFS transporter|nr:MFS transporter [Cytophagaceae bacterium]